MFSELDVDSATNAVKTELLPVQETDNPYGIKITNTACRKWLANKQNIEIINSVWRDLHISNKFVYFLGDKAPQPKYSAACECFATFPSSFQK